MITEYHNEEDVLRELTCAVERFWSMWNGWMEKKVCHLKRASKMEYATKDIHVNKQQYKVLVCWDKHVKSYAISLQTMYDTTRGKIRIAFSPYLEKERIIIESPHFTKRVRERNKRFVADNFNTVKYTRNGRQYELLVYPDDGIVDITRRSLKHPNMTYFITTMNIDMCTGKNYQELLHRAADGASFDDIFEWK